MHGISLQFCLAFVNRNLKSVFSFSVHNYVFPELFCLISPILLSYVYSAKPRNSQIKTMRLKVEKNNISQNDVIYCYTKTRRSSTDNKWLANVERVHGYLVPESYMLIVSCRYRKGCSGLCSDKKYDLRFPGACSYREIGNCENRREASRTEICQALSCLK